MYYDRFDVAAAWYVYLAETHNGQWCPRYRRFCRLSSWYSVGYNGISLSDNAKAILARLRRKDSAKRAWERRRTLERYKDMGFVPRSARY